MAKENKYCLVCAEPSTEEYYGYYFCKEHAWLKEFDPEELEMVVILRLEGKSPEEIEGYYGTKHPWGYVPWLSDVDQE